MIAVLFDTETTGLTQNRVVKIDKQPHVLELYACKANLDTGEVLAEIDHLIRPPTEESIDLKVAEKSHGIKWDMVKDKPTFAEIADEAIQFLGSCDTVIAHNLSFDMEVIEIEAQRLGMKTMWPRRKLCTVEATVYIKGYRLNLSDLYEMLFKEKFAGAHRAKVDVMALLRCCVELRSRGVL